MAEEFRSKTQDVEIRGLIALNQIFKERNWPFPYYYHLEQECSALELANLIDLPLDKIEAVFINGKAYGLEEGWIKPGDRVTFVSPGTPGPHRFLLGIAKLPKK